jgi:hypothetical protein
MRNMNLGCPPVRGPVAHGYNDMTNGFTDWLRCVFGLTQLVTA